MISRKSFFSALATTIRPTSMAAVLALLSINEPRRLMTVYVLAGLAFTVAFGLVVVFVVAGTVSGIQITAGTDRTNGTAEILGGLALLGLGIYVSQRRMKPGQADQIVRTPGRWTKLREQHVTPRTAALAGPATRIPGVFYLVALSLVVASEGSAGWRFGGRPHLQRGLVCGCQSWRLRFASWIRRPHDPRSGGIEAWTKTPHARDRPRRVARALAPS